MGGFRAVLNVATSFAQYGYAIRGNDRMSTTSRYNRRDFLKVAAPAAIAITQVIAPAHPAELQDGQAKYLPVFFSDPEWKFVTAAVDRLIPADPHGPGGVEAGVPVFIDRQLDLPYGHGAYFYMQGPFQPDAHPTLGYQLQYSPRELYRVGIAAADSVCNQTKGKVFSELPHLDQEQFLTSLEHGSVTLQGPPAATFFAQLLANTREGYFADPMYGGNRGMGGWKMIGFPGARADFTNWMDQQGRAYPYGPTAIHGSRS
jgi:gluconate 2-dehydrogenase gamma chain